MKSISFESQCVRPVQEERHSRPHQLPIYATAAFAFDTLEAGDAAFGGQQAGHVYSRFGNPTIDGVAQKLARLEGYGLAEAAGAVLVSSGMSAISTLAMSLLQPGDRILTQGNLYGGTTELFKKILQPYGIEPIFMDLQDTQEATRLLAEDSSIRMLYLETPANPTLQCLDLETLEKIAHQHHCYTVADNTFATPYLQRPLTFGFDFVIHSTTKYLNGHGNSVAGVIVGREKSEVWDRVFPTMKLLGTNCNAWDAWLINNGLKTLALRMERHSHNAQQVAEFLEEQPEVSKVNYLGLPNHPDHALARRQMSGFGGMLSFELKGGLKAAHVFMNATRLATIAPTLGDVDTLLLHPATMSHRNVDPDVRASFGITDGLVRVNVGIEQAEDIIKDMEQALSKVHS